MSDLKVPERALKNWRELLRQAEVARLAADTYIAGVVDSLGLDLARIASIDPVSGAITLKADEEKGET